MENQLKEGAMEKEYNSIRLTEISNQTYKYYFNFEQPVSNSELAKFKHDVKSGKAYLLDIKNRFDVIEEDSFKDLKLPIASITIKLDGEDELEENLVESSNPLKDAAEEHKKKQKGIGAFVNLNAGDVEKGNAMFNNATDVGSAPASGGMGEDLSDSHSDNFEYTLQSFANQIEVVGPEYRGAPYPSFNECAINESNIPDNMRCKSVDIDAEGNTIKLNWITQEEFDLGDAENFLYEVDRAIECLVDECNFTRQFDVAVHVECRDGYEYGHFEDVLKFNISMNENINLRKALNDLDLSTMTTDFVNMYDAANLSEEDKIKLANMLTSDDKDINDIYNFLAEGQQTQHIIKYKDMLIEYDFYNHGEYTVQYQGDDVWFDTLDAAKKFIDEIQGGIKTESLKESYGKYDWIDYNDLPEDLWEKIEAVLPEDCEYDRALMFERKNSAKAAAEAIEALNIGVYAEVEYNEDDNNYPFMLNLSVDDLSILE